MGSPTNTQKLRTPEGQAIKLRKLAETAAKDMAAAHPDAPVDRAVPPRHRKVDLFF
jgi:hypothetical protein